MSEIMTVASMVRRLLHKVKLLKNTHSQSLTDSYMVGLYNGLELAIAVMENREPVYEQVGQTKYDTRRNLYDVWHTDEIALVRFALCMRDKLALARERGRHGWETAPCEHLSELLREQVAKGDPLDVANFCMMLHQQGCRIAPEDDGR